MWGEVNLQAPSRSVLDIMPATEHVQSRLGSITQTIYLQGRG